MMPAVSNIYRNSVNNNYSTPAGVEFLNMLTAINIQTLWVWN